MQSAALPGSILGNSAGMRRSTCTRRGKAEIPDNSETVLTFFVKNFHVRIQKYVLKLFAKALSHYDIGSWGWTSFPDSPDFS